MSDPFVAEIRIFGFNFAPTGWAQCNGQLLPLSQNTALFSLLGTFYGGDGKSTFALPDLEGAVPTHQGQGSGLQDWSIGELQGSDFITLLQTEMPAHIHGFQATTSAGSTNSAATNQLGKGQSGNPVSGTTQARVYSPNAPQTPMSFQALSVSGSSLPHNNLMPYLVMNYCIALQGVFPARP